MPTEFEYAWSAGIIDGEGSIRVQKYFPHGKLKHVYHQLRVVVDNTDPEMILKLKSIFGQNIYFGQKPKNERSKQIYGWCAIGRGAEDVINKVLPYLVTKRKQAEIALEFARTIRNPGRRGVSLETRKMRDQYTNELSDEKHKMFTPRPGLFKSKG